MSSSRSYPAGAPGCRRIWLAPICLIAFIGGCGPQTTPPPPGGQAGAPAPVAKTAAPAAVAEVNTSPPAKKKKRKRKERPKRNLSDYGLFEGPLAEMRPAAGVIPYDLNSPLFSDYAWKSRVIKVPDGTKIEYHEGSSFDFPVGTIIAKTFYYPHDFDHPEQGRRLIETRILMRRKDGWIGVPYVWNDEQTDAVSEVAGATVNVSWKHYDGEERSIPYIVPNVNDCKRCHKMGEVFEPIGPRARHLNKDYDYEQGAENQLAYWTRMGILAGAPDDPARAPKLAAWNDESSGTVDQRARAWLEINCAHCHSSIGPARNSGLYLLSSVTDPYKLGVYKTPVAAGRGSGGRKYDVVPGQPDESIMLFRLESTHPGMAMPEFGRTLVHEEANALIRRWIQEMEVPEGFDISNAVGEFQSLSDEQLAAFAQEVAEQGDPARGEEIFHRKRLNCLKCHAVGGVGEGVGPDLLQPRDDKTLNYLIESVLLPNKVLRKGFETVIVVTDDGQAFSGVVIDETDTELVLRDLTRPEISIPKNTIEDRVPGNSLMPTNVVAMATRQDVVDLLRFLQELGATADYQMSDEPLIRRWQILDPLPGNIGQVDADEFMAESNDRRDLTWEPAYSRVAGDLALETAMTAPQTAVRIVRSQIDVVTAGELSIQLNPAAGLRIWLDGVPVATADLASLTVQAGVHTLSFWIDLDRRSEKTLRCAVLPADGSPARVRFRRDGAT